MVSIRVRIRVRVSFMVWVRENVREGNVQGGSVFIYVCISIVFTVYASFGRAPLRLTNVGGRW